MKKLIIAAAIVCAAAMSQAAAFNWTASGVYDIAGTTLYSGDAAIYYYVSSAGASTAAFATDVTMDKGAFNLTLDDEMFVGNTTYKFYYAMTDEAGNVFTSTTKMKKAQQSSTQVVAFAAGGTWVAAPEPTSGLLLLLGMAGLALKRKRA